MKRIKVDELQIHDVIELITEVIDELDFAYGRLDWETIARDKSLKDRLEAIRDGFRTDILLNV